VIIDVKRLSSTPRFRSGTTWRPGLATPSKCSVLEAPPIDFRHAGPFWLSSWLSESMPGARGQTKPVQLTKFEFKTGDPPGTRTRNPSIKNSQAHRP
jgi:hypothetical protein